MAEQWTGYREQREALRDRIAQQDTTIAAQINRERDFVARISQLEGENSALRLASTEQDNHLNIAIERGDEWQSKCYSLEGEVAELKEKIEQDDAEALSRLCGLYKENIDRLTAENAALREDKEPKQYGCPVCKQSGCECRAQVRY
jgi:chromosome segregation ATPase